MMRLDKRTGIGDAGAVYEFRVKGRSVEATLTDEEWSLEADDVVQEFATKLRKRYNWIGRVYLTGRSGGWLAIVDVAGTTRHDARKRSLEIIDRMVDKAYRDFCKEIEEKYPRKVEAS